MDILEWLRERRVSAEAYAAEALVESFLDEMEKGNRGEDSSLAMIPSYVGTEKTVPADTPVAVIDAGGTNLRTCIARFKESGEIEISHFNKQAMPGRDRELTVDEFYTVLVDALEPLKDEFEQIGFCFSYPAAILPDFDGRLLHWTKEIKIPGLVGEHIGSLLIKALEARGVCGKKVVILNDTAAALLAGMATGQTFGASSYVGFILGTGVNTAYVEQNDRISKLMGELGAGSQVINTESGGFSVFERSVFDAQLDERSENPGGHLYEKTMSGVYLGPITLEVLRALCDEPVFSSSGAAALADLEELGLIEIDNLAAKNGRDVGVLGSDAFSDSDREIMATVFEAVVGRAAVFAAAGLAAAVIKSGAGTQADHPVCINIDGTTYYKTHRLAEQVQAHLSALLDARGLHYRCIHVDDAPVVGAAIAGLTTF